DPHIVVTADPQGVHAGARWTPWRTSASRSILWAGTPLAAARRHIQPCSRRPLAWSTALQKRCAFRHCLIRLRNSATALDMSKEAPPCTGGYLAKVLR